MKELLISLGIGALSGGITTLLMTIFSDRRNYLKQQLEWHVKLLARVEEVEERMARLEEIEDQIAKINSKLERRKISLAELDFLYAMVNNIAPSFQSRIICPEEESNNA